MHCIYRASAYYIVTKYKHQYSSSAVAEAEKGF